MKTFTYRLVFLLFISSVLLCSCSPSQEVVATVDGSQITRAQVRARLALYEEAPSESKPVTEQQTKFTDARATLTQLINERLLLLEAQKQGILIDIKRVSPAESRKAVQQVLEKLGREVTFPSYKDAHSYYKQHAKEFSTQARFQLDHLLTAKENQAWELKEQIENGSLSMAEAARRQGNKNPDSDHLITVSGMPAGIAAILPGLKLNQVSPPIATPYGYHLIRIKRKLPAGRIPFPEVENKIKDLLFAERLRKNYQNWLKQSWEQHTIKIYHQHLTGL